ncbi:hypothetical protein ACWGM0_05610 [Sphingomonas bisphenolicum]
MAASTSLSDPTPNPAESTLDVALDFVAAENCATEHAQTISLQPDKVDSIPSESVQKCKAAQNKSAISLTTATKRNDLEIASSNVAAKMRIAASEILMSRLAEGANVNAPPMFNPGFDAKITRHIYCLRLALDRKMEGVYLGDPWINDLKKQSKADVWQAFMAVGNAACTYTREAYLSEFSHTLNQIDRKDRSYFEAKFGLPAVEQMALKNYMSVIFTTQEATE